MMSLSEFLYNKIYQCSFKTVQNLNRSTQLQLLWHEHIESSSSSSSVTRILIKSVQSLSNIFHDWIHTWMWAWGWTVVFLCVEAGPEAMTGLTRLTLAVTVSLVGLSAFSPELSMESCWAWTNVLISWQNKVSTFTLIQCKTYWWILRRSSPNL